MLNLYPFWTRVDPVLTKDLLASIGYKCKTGQALDSEERAYLTDSIAQILNGVPAARALRLTAPTGKRRETLSERNILIHKRVQELLAAGHSKSSAYERVAAEPMAAKRRGGENLSEKAIEKIYTAISAAISPPKKLVDGK